MARLGAVQPIQVDFREQEGAAFHNLRHPGRNGNAVDEMTTAQMKRERAVGKQATALRPPQFDNRFSNSPPSNVVAKRWPRSVGWTWTWKTACR